MAKTGRPRKADPQDVMAAVDKMIDDYRQSESVEDIDDFRLMQLLGVSATTVDRYYDGEADERLTAHRNKIANNNNNITDTEDDISINITYGEAVKKLIAFRRSACAAHIASRGGNVTGWIFLSKQPRWGGFQDVQKTESRGTQSINVTIRGADGKQIDV